ncbi:MAG TPA: toll/interleukin-1 receptor domain-containing protein [Terriglobia bacterium]|nr:toll/interleukin-1 receptor domain-containing protein [Terriglobia bacterium]
MSRKKSLLPREVFLSHSAKDRLFVERLARVLQGHGVPFWYSGTNIVGAREWHAEIGQALARCDWFLLVLSPHSIKSPWVERELLYALIDARYRNRIIPVLWRSCNPMTLSWTLGGFQLVDFTAGFEKGCRNLLRVWGIGYKGARAGRH